MPGIYIAESRQSIQYTGSNSAEIDAAITNLTIDSETGGVLTVTSSGSQYEVNAGDWINFWQGYINGVYTDSQFNFFFTENAIGSDVTGLQDQIDTINTGLASLGGAAVRSAGVASAGTLLLNTPVNVAVQLIPAMADSSYNAYAYIFGTGVNLSQVAINSVTVTDSDTVTVNVQTSLVSLPGVHILVVAKD